MKENEAKQLKPGDIIFVRMKVYESPLSDAEVKNNFLVAVYDYQDVRRSQKFFIPASVIRTRNNEPLEIEPPRRKFRAGDIIKSPYGSLCEVTEDEDYTVRVKIRAGEAESYVCNPKLVCAVEDRTDRKGEK